MLKIHNWIVLFPVYQDKMLNLTSYENAPKLMDSWLSDWALAFQQLPLLTRALLI